MSAEAGTAPVIERLRAACALGTRPRRPPRGLLPLCRPVVRARGPGRGARRRVRRRCRRVRRAGPGRRRYRRAAARLAGTEPVVEEVRISDVAAWQRQRLNDGVLSVAVGSRREALRDAPVCPWPTGGNRAGRRLDVRSGARAGELLRELAARSGVSLASMTLAAWYRALVAWDARTSMLPIGCCTTARVRPELRTTLGNLTNTVIVAPGPQWSRFGSADLLDAAHQAMQEALGSVDLPFELVFGDGPVQDEQIGVRFTFVEDPPSSGDGPLRGAAVRFGYAKSLLSCEVHVSGGDLRVWVDYRPAQFAQQVPGRLAALLRQELTVRQRWAG